METPKSTIKEFFIYLFVAITLSVSIGNLLDILFTIIEKLVPDSLSGANSMYYYDMSTLPRLAIASLIILFPLYLLFSWLAAKDVTKHPERKEVFVRRAFIYFALFLSLCTIIGTGIAAVYSFLGGELTARFLWKAISVLVVSASVFGYYAYSLRRDYRTMTKLPIIISALATVAVIGVIAWSISVFGSPATMRAMRFDQTRVSDLQSITYQVQEYTVNKGVLPASIEEAYRGSRYAQDLDIPMDPETSVSYSYEVVTQPETYKNSSAAQYTLKTDAKYKLCATFALATTDGQAVVEPGKSGAVSWSHDAGKYCFDRLIVKD